VTGRRRSLTEGFEALDHLPDRTPEMAFQDRPSRAFAELAPFRDGAIYLGFYSGASEWERHTAGDEIVLVLEGFTTVVLLVDGVEQRTALAANELIVVPAGTWHRFEASQRLKVMTVTPQPTDHALEVPR
jgi:mannose-6-phosphate isomerase-like protein (cupin superfamily)